MANFDDLKKLDQAKKALKEIAELQKKITDDGRRYNKEGDLGVKASKELLDLKYKQLNAEGQIKKLLEDQREEAKGTAQDRLKLDKELFNLSKKANSAAKANSDLILKGFGIQKSNKQLIEAANVAREKGNIKEAQGLSKLEALRQDAIDQLEEGSFNPASFNEKFKEISDEFADEIRTNPGLAAAFEGIGDKFGEMTEDQVNAITNALDADLPFLDTIKGFQDTLENIGSVLATPQTALLAAAGVLVNSIKDFVLGANELRNELGLTAGAAAELQAETTVASLQAKIFGGNAEVAAGAVSEIAKQTGTASSSSLELASNFADLATATGLSAENIATLTNLQALSTGQSLEEASARLEGVKAIADSRGILRSAVFEDVATAAKDSAIGFGKTAEELAKAALETRKFGLELSAVTQIGEKLLDLESSISAEAELQVLFGKNINLSKAREAAFNRDAATLAREVRAQFGGIADLSELNAAQVSSLTDNLGLSNEQLAKLIAGEDIFNAKQEEANESLFQKFGMFVGIATVISGLIGAILGGLGFFTGGLSFAGLKAMGAGAVSGAAIGAGIGIAGSAAMSVADATISPKGQGSMSTGNTIVQGVSNDNLFMGTQAMSSMNLEIDRTTKAVSDLGPKFDAMNETLNNLGTIISSGNSGIVSAVKQSSADG